MRGSCRANASKHEWGSGVSELILTLQHGLAPAQQPQSGRKHCLGCERQVPTCLQYFCGYADWCKERVRMLPVNDCVWLNLCCCWSL